MSEFDCIIQIETVKNVQTIKGGERMLLEERLDEIVKIVNERGSISNQELVKMLGDRKSTRLNSSHIEESRMPSSA